MQVVTTQTSHSVDNKTLSYALAKNTIWGKVKLLQLGLIKYIWSLNFSFHKSFVHHNSLIW